MPLVIHLPACNDDYDEATNKFRKHPAVDVTFEHSLQAIFKWEGHWHKAFLNPLDDRTPEQSLDYICCMVIGDIPEYFVERLTKEDVNKIQKYIETPQTATIIKEHPDGAQGGGRHGNTTGQLQTAELLYYYMVEIGIPWEASLWHLSRLTTLMRIYSEENKPKKKMGKKATAERNAALNAQRRRKLGL